MEKQNYYIASFSGGKDSTAMVLRLIELGEPLDEVLFCDTTMEFPAMMRHIEMVKHVIEDAGVKFTTLRAEKDFEWWLIEKEVARKPGHDLHGRDGYGWPTTKSRWCTKHLKIEQMLKYAKTLQGAYNVIQYVGIAADEDYRLERENNQGDHIRHPLRDWGWTEDEALQYCYSHGYDWEGLYEIKKHPKTGRARVSCWCCPLQSYDDLRILRKNFPDLWGKLLDMDRKQCKSFFQHGYTVSDFDRRFALEDALAEAGHSITNRAFFADNKRLLAGETSLNDILAERVKKERSAK